MAGEKSDRALQKSVIQAVAQIGNQAKAGMIDQIGAQVIANPLISAVPTSAMATTVQRIVEVLRNKILQINGVLGSRHD